MRSFVIFTLFVVSSVSVAQTREEIVRGDKAKVEAAGFWMYNDIPGAFEKAKSTGKPICVVLRCLPCHECVKLDDELVDTHPVIRPLLEQFVCVRQVSTNGLDLNLFQYDTDQSFAVFLLNADRTIYCRFGTRSHRTEWYGDVSLDGLSKALQAALDLHQNFDSVRESLAGKTGAPAEVVSPEKYPSLKDKFTDKLNYEGDVVKSCIHCHQIGDAQREFYWTQKKPIPDHVLFPFPHPKVVGLVMDPDELATVKHVTEGSQAAKAGIRPGDRIAKLNGQPMLSIADIQWVLHNTSSDGGAVQVALKRGDRELKTSMELEEKWRLADDISWRVTSWGLRRMAAGGMYLENVSADDRRKRDLSPDGMALFVKRAGKYGPHGTARRIGIREGDVIVEFDGRNDLTSEQALHTHVVTERTPGQKVAVKVKRGRQTRTFQLPLQR